VQERTQGVLGRHLARHIDAVLRDAVVPFAVAAEATLLGQRRGDVLDVHFLGARVERPELPAARGLHPVADAFHSFSFDRRAIIADRW
jgi:hypothetical protein